MLGRAEKYSMLNLDHYFSIDLRLNTHYEHNVHRRPTKIISQVSYVLCQLSSTPADHKHVTSVRYVD